MIRLFGWEGCDSFNSEELALVHKTLRATTEKVVRAMQSIANGIENA